MADSVRRLFRICTSFWTVFPVRMNRTPETKDSRENKRCSATECSTRVELVCTMEMFDQR